MIERTKISLGAVWEEAFAFCKAEAALIAPLALLGFGLPLVVLGMVMPAQVSLDGQNAIGPWMLWLPFHMLLNLLGTLSVTALTTRAGISVREALAITWSRLPAAFGVVIVAFGAFLLLWVVVGIAGGTEMSLAGKPGPVSLFLMLAALVLLVWGTLRLLPVWAAIISGGSTGWIALRTTLSLTRGLAPLLLLLRVVQMLSVFTVLTVLTIPIHAVLQLGGRLIGFDAGAELLATLISCALAAGIAALWTVFVATLYRRMTSARAAAVSE